MPWKDERRRAAGRSTMSCGMLHPYETSGASAQAGQGIWRLTAPAPCLLQHGTQTDTQATESLRANAAPTSTAHRARVSSVGVPALDHRSLSVVARVDACPEARRRA